MSNEFWLGVVVTLVVGIPGAYIIAILANMHTPKLVNFLDSRKLLKKHKTRQQALVVFNRIKSFHDRSADRYAHYILLSTGSVLSALLASVFLNIFFNHVYDIPIGIDDAVILLIATVAILSAAIFLTAIYETARQLERFDDYKKEFETRWGAIDD
jgi:putative flippase GtrA